MHPSSVSLFKYIAVVIDAATSYSLFLSAPKYLPCRSSAVVMAIFTNFYDFETLQILEVVHS